MTRRRLYSILMISWVAFVFLLTSIPIPHFEAPELYLDKVAHFGAYGVMGFLCAMWRRESAGPAKRAILVSVAVAAAIGAADELHQHWIPGRSTEVLDWLADAAGGAIGALSSGFLPRWINFLRTE